LNVILSAQFFCKDLNSFYLEVGRLRILVVRYDLVIGHRSVRRELFIPFFCRFYPAVVTGKPVVDNKMTIRFILIGNTTQ